MGGKRNQAQRTKNNVKPSSSSRSADLLGKDATKLVGFISFKQNMFAGKSELLATEDFGCIDPNFQVSLKKLSKKDAITKQKGLQELTELFKNSGLDPCKALLPYWSQVFCNLSLDVDNKVREHTQIAHKALAACVGRNLAPHLRQIMPVWFISQFDTYPPAASSATSSLKATFPENKIKEVLSFCHDEIFSFIQDNLINQTPQSLSKPDMSKEDSEAKYERVVICCLNGYSHFIENLNAGVSDEVNEKFVSSNKEFLSSNKYWNFSSHKSSQIRGAWYGSLISLCKHRIQFVKEESKHLLKTVFSNLDESDPMVLPLVWESALYSLQIMKECNQHINLEKVVFPKVCCVLERGGLGNAATIYPNLLPLLSNLSDSLIDKHKFYLTFFKSLLTGLKQHPVKLSHSESEIIVNTFMECFRYVIMLHNEENDFCTGLINEQLLELMKEVESDSSYRVIVLSLYPGIVDLVSYWQRSMPTYSSYSGFLQYFWDSLNPQFVQQFSSCIHDLSLASHVLYCQHKFFETFLRPKIRNKKNLRVKFDSLEITDELIIEDVPPAVTINPEIKKCIDNLGCELLKAYYSSTENNESISNEFKILCIYQLSLTVKLFGFEFFLKSCSLDCSEFYLKLQSWLKDDTVPVEPILVMTFTALGSIKENEQEKNLLEELILITRPEMLVQEAVKLCLTGRSEYSQIRSWLKNEDVRGVLLSFVESVHDDVSSKNFKVLKFCLSASKSKEYIIGDETVAQILIKLNSLIENADSCEMKRIVSLLEDVFKEDNSHFIKNYSDSVFNLVTSLFYKSLLSVENPIPMRILDKALSCCCKALSIDGKEFRTFTKDCDVLICRYFEERVNQTGIVDINNVVNVTYTLIASLASKFDSNKSELGVKLSKDLLSNVLNIIKNKSENKIVDISLTALAVYGDIPCEDYVQNKFTLKEGVWDPLKEIELCSYSQIILFSLKLIYRLLGENITDTVGNTMQDNLLSNDDISCLGGLILDYTYALALLRTVSKYYSSCKQHFYSMKFIEPLAPSLKELVQRIDESIYPSLFLTLSERATQSVLWTKTDEIIRVEFLEQESQEVEVVNERILTTSLEESSLRALRNKLKSNKRGLESFISFISWKFETSNKAEATALYNKSINNVGLLEMSMSSEIARYLTELIKYDDGIIEKKTWDFIVNSIAAWSQSLDKTQHPKYCKEYVGFVVSFSNLFITFSAYLNSDLSASSLSHAREERNKYIKQSWDVFSSDVHSAIFACWKRFAEQCTTYEMEPLSLLLIESMSNAVCHIAQGGKLSFKQNYELLSVSKTCSDFLLSPCPAVQITSFLMLQSVIVYLAKLDSNLDENSADKISCLLLKETLFKTQTVVETMLHDFKLGVMCLVEPYTDSYNYTRANLMSWLILLDIFKAADSRIRHLYACWMKEERILNHLMDCLLHLLPNLVVFASDSHSKKLQEIFSSTPSFSYSGWTSNRLSALSAFIYVHVLRVLPLLSRLWYSESEPKKRDFIDKFTAPYVSPLLINEEINFALNETKKCDNLSLETLPTARLVNAIFTIEDSKAELAIQLSHNHPFTPPKVDVSKSVVSSGQSNQKLKQLTLFPTLQNGSLWDCIIVWKNYLDKKFDGVEECYICYSVLHYGTHHLPKQSCRTCKKRFHSACLYKWFTSSNKSTCPICRNLF